MIIRVPKKYDLKIGELLFVDVRRFGSNEVIASLGNCVMVTKSSPLNKNENEVEITDFPTI